VWRVLRHLCFWAKNAGGGFKNVKKLKKKLQNDNEQRKKRGKVRKIEKKDAKRCAICGVFSKSGKNPACSPVAHQGSNFSGMTSQME